MKMSEEMAVRLHRMMWIDMQKELGDKRCSGRAAYKEDWLREHFPGEHFMHNCILCEYVTQQTGNRPLLGCADCKLCPIKWPGDNCSLREREGGVNYLQSPISEILALPARNEKFTGFEAKYFAYDKATADKMYYDYRESLLSKASGISALSAIKDHVKAIQEKAVQQSNLSKIYGDTKMELAKASGLPAGDTTTDHIKAIQEKAVEEYFEKNPGTKLATMDVDQAFKQYADEQKAPIFKQLSKASGLSENNHAVADHIEWFKNKSKQEGRDEANEHMKYLLAKQSGLDRNRPVDYHIREIVKNSMEAGAAEERDRIQEKIYEVLLS